MDKLTKSVQNEVLWSMMFADDVVQVNENPNVLVGKHWLEILKKNSLKISGTKMEFLGFRFNNTVRDNGGNHNGRLKGQLINKVKKFIYLGPVVQKNGIIVWRMPIKLDVALRWQKAPGGVLCYKKVPLKVKRMLYKTVVRPTMVYGSECWAINKKEKLKIKVGKMRILR